MQEQTVALQIEDCAMPRSLPLSELREALKPLGYHLRRERYCERPVREYLASELSPGLREKYLTFFDDHLFFNEVCAGAKNHHWWKGGLAEHCSEMIGLGLDLHSLYKGDLDQITREDIVISVYLHDFAKIWAYRYITDEERASNPRKFLPQQIFTYTNGQFDILDQESKTLLELGRAGIVPTDQQWSSVLFAEGGFSDRHWTFSGTSSTGATVNKRNHLAPFLHILDLYSSQILGRSLV